MRGEGAGYGLIADRLAIATSTAFRWVNPDAQKASLAYSRAYKDAHREQVRAQNRAYRATHKAECPQCGGEMLRETAHRGGVCKPCHQDEADAKAREVERLWAAGLSHPEICARLGWSKGHLGAEIHRLRSLGYDLPYRRPRLKQAPRFPEQVAA